MNTWTLYLCSINNLAIANPSPPLFPFPQKMTKDWSSKSFSWSHSMQLVAALSIRSMDRIGSCCIVYWSHSRICWALRIFIHRNWATKERKKIQTELIALAQEREGITFFCLYLWSGFSNFIKKFQLLVCHPVGVYTAIDHSAFRTAYRCLRHDNHCGARAFKVLFRALFD